MFGKKKQAPVKKLDVKHEGMGEVKVEIKIMPLVKIERHQLNVNGRDQKPEFRIEIAERDVITLSPREYDELFMEMLRHKDAGELIHDISEVHLEEHTKGENEAMRAFAGLEEALKGGLGEMIARAGKK